MVYVARPGIIAASRRRATAASYPATVLADSPILYLRLEETSGSACADSSGTGRNGTANGTFTRNVAGHAGLGVGVTLNGTAADYISVPSDSGLDITGTNPVTYECWVAITQHTNPQMMMVKGFGGGLGSENYAFWIDATSGQTMATPNSSNSVTLTSTLGIPTDGAWHHVAFTRTSTTMTMYLDGAPNGSVSSGVPGSAASGRPFLIGAGYYDSTTTVKYPLNGKIDEIAVYNTALSAARIAAHYAAAV